MVCCRSSQLVRVRAQVDCVAGVFVGERARERSAKL